MTALFIVIGGVFGAVIGSFLNVVIYRVPLKKSIAFPASACPHCGHAIASYDNIPVISWLVLRGRCRYCSAPISIRYPIVELGTALFFALVIAVFLPGLLATGSTAALIAAILAIVAFLYLAAISVALAFIDLENFRLPNVIVLPAYAVGAILLVASSLLAGDPFQLTRAAIGAAALFGLYFLLAIVYPGGMGFGDVKLAGVLGLYLAWVGWGELVVGGFGAFVLGGIFGVVLLIFRSAGRKSRIPFGPWMILGAWIGILWGGDISDWYLALFGLNG